VNLELGGIAAGVEKVEVKIYSATGAEVWSEEIAVQGNGKVVARLEPGLRLSKGVYQVSVQAGVQTAGRKLIIR
jgi:hypothetical protein